MRNHIHLLINGQPVRLGAAEAFVTLSDYLRIHRRLIGTKVVCAEGDCGACTVLVGRTDADGAIRYAAINSCIHLMCQLDATHVVTIEGLTPSDGSLNPIQQSMVDCHGTQCGFCTPGFVVALQGLMQEGAGCDDACIRRGLVGNLCRCTGYDSIVKSALRTDRSALKHVDEIYQPEAIAPQLASAAAEPVRIDLPEHQALLFKPVTLEQAVRFRAENPDAVIISGASDLGVLLNKRVRGIHAGMVMSGLRSLAYVRREGNTLLVGATATLTQLEHVANAELPELGRYLAWFGSPLIRNAGTLAGNLATASPIGDSAPPLIAIGAQVVLAGPAGMRTLPIEQFIIGYRKTALQPGELIAEVRLPIPAPGEIVRFYKVSRRKDLDIATFSAAFWLRLNGRTIEDLRIAMGAVGPTVLRMKRTEQSLRGRSATLEHFEAAARIARDEVTPISDVRGSEAYRRLLAGNAVLKFFREEFSNDAGSNGDTAADGNGDPRGGATVRAGLPEPTIARHPEGSR